MPINAVPSPMARYLRKLINEHEPEHFPGETVTIVSLRSRNLHYRYLEFIMGNMQQGRNIITCLS